MSAEAFDRAAELFERLLARPAGERAEALAAATRDDPEARALVEGMLRGEEQVPDALDRPVAVPAGLSAGALPAIEGYEVRGVLGEGGMGIVYEGRQLAPSRTVALKLVRPGLVTPELVRRFRREAEVLGWLNHPGIAQVYEAGTADTPSGPRPFIAMELVRGERVDAWAARARPPLARRLELLARLCDAVHHAHARGVVHRDLKPANVLVTEAGDLKVLDFGIARITDSDRTLSTRATGVGEVLGTLPYMAPEQVGADPAAVDTRADVYALGVLAYELLSGQRPLDVREKSLPEAARAIAEDEPTTLGALDRRLRGDVETIVGKALEKDPERRYASADELASDLRRHLADEPILARPPSRGYQLAKFARRHRGLVAGVVTAFVVLLAGAVASTALYLQKSRLLEEKSDEVRTANEVIAFLEGVFAQADPYRADELSVRDVALAAAGRVQDELGDRPAVRERLLGVIGTTLAHLQLDAEARPLLEEAAERLARRHGRADARYLDVAEDLAPLLAFEGRFDEGVALQRHVLATRRETLGDGPGVARALNVLATILANRDHDEADALLEEALALYAEHLGPDDTLTWTVRHNVAARRYAQGRYAEAEALFRAVLAAAPEELEARQVFSRLMLGNCLRALARKQEAEEVLREAERRALAAFGEAGAVTCSVRQALSGLLADTGRADEAAAMLERQLEQVERRYGRDSAQYASGLGDLAFAVHDTARREDAEALYLEAAERLAALSGEDGMERLQALHNLGILYMDLGRLERAEEVQRDVLARRRRTLGPDHPVTLTSVRGLGQILVRTQRYEEALELRRHAYRCAVRDQGPAVPLTQTARLEVVYALIHTGGHDEAEELLDEAEAHLAEQAEPDFHAVQIAKHREQLAAARATVEGAP